jgi:ADP-ribose pyrophosphatase YjhB (NUDIX family)
MVAIARGSSSMAEVQHVFGTQIDGHTYHSRRAVYAVIPDRAGRVATVQEHGHLWLPGGGIEAGESPEQALVREVEEECAQRLHIAEKIGEALQYFYAPSEETYFAMHAIFYAGAFLGQTPGQLALPCVWVFPDDTAPFFHASHVWAAQSLRKGTSPMYHCNPRDYLPDVKDGLTHRERIILQCLYDLQKERGGRNVPSGMLYGTVVEHVNMSVEEMQSILVRLIGHKLLP